LEQLEAAAEGLAERSPMAATKLVEAALDAADTPPRSATAARSSCSCGATG